MKEGGLRMDYRMDVQWTGEEGVGRSGLGKRGKTSPSGRGCKKGRVDLERIWEISKSGKSKGVKVSPKSVRSKAKGSPA